jgi:hypothetical protein
MDLGKIWRRPETQAPRVATLAHGSRLLLYDRTLGRQLDPRLRPNRADA